MKPELWIAVCGSGFGAPWPLSYNPVILALILFHRISKSFQQTKQRELFHITLFNLVVHLEEHGRLLVPLFL